MGCSFTLDLRIDTHPHQESVHDRIFPQLPDHQREKNFIMNNNITQFGKNTTNVKKGANDHEGFDQESTRSLNRPQTDSVPGKNLKSDKIRRRHSFDDNSGGYMGL